MKRGGEARKWKRTNPRLFFNIHSIIIKTKENSSNWFEIFLSLSLLLSIEHFENFFQNLRSDATLGTRFHLSESLQRKFLLPLDSSLVVMWKRSTIFSEAIHGEMKKGGGKREKERERELEVARCSIFRINSTTIKGGKRRVHEKRTKKSTPRAK